MNNMLKPNPATNISIVNPVAPKPTDTTDINYENADEILIDELSKAGIWDTNLRVKVATKVLLAKMTILQTKVDGALAILMQK